VTTTPALAPVSSVQSAPSATTEDLTDRQVHVFVTIAAAVLIAAFVLLALYAREGILPASTSFRDLTEAAFATLI
jgi:hypothetical protein